MSKMQEVFNRIQASKQEQKKLKAVYRDALANSGEYQKIIDDIKSLRERKLQIEHAIGKDFHSEISKLESIKSSINEDNVMLSDLALNKIVKGESLELSDEHNNDYEPIFSVRFKKT